MEGGLNGRPINHLIPSIMKSIKPVLATVALTIAALTIANGAEALLSPRAAANAPRTTANAEAASCHAGHPHDASEAGSTNAPAVHGALMAHCQMKAGAHSHGSCCN